MFAAPVIAAIQAHAVACYPNEACGAVTADGFVPMENKHPEPQAHFDCQEPATELLLSGGMLAFVHSHPDGPDAPSAHDIGAQRAMDVPWGLVVSHPDGADTPYFWGDMLEPPPLVGRPFRHGPSGTDGRGDCGALIRDYYRLERGILIPDFPRDDDWWKIPGKDLYSQHFGEAGFVEADRNDPQVGDVVLIQFRTPRDNLVPNHAGIYLGGGLMLHHLSGTLSRPEPVLRWKDYVRGWLRHAAR